MPAGGAGGGGVGSGTGPIQGLTGCFFWYAADYIGQSNAAPILYWKDLSGSGNNLTPAASSNIPTLYTNIINNLPIVRFSGINYLKAAVNNSAGTQGTNLGVFSVYKSTGNYPQFLFSSVGGAVGRAFDFGLAVSSSYGFCYTNGGFETSFNLNSGILSNQFLLRHDCFRNTDNQFTFGYFGVDVASGTISLTDPGAGTDNLIMGYSDVPGYQNYFQGDIAEIIGYDLSMSPSAKTAVNNYLYDKYFVPSSTTYTTPPLSISGCFLWFKSTSIGITGDNGTQVQYWKDDSGSGNHVTINMASSSTWVFPTFYHDQINGYPTIRYTNTPTSYNYLYTQNGSGLNFYDNDLTVFSVFKCSDVADQQRIFGITTPTKIIFCVGLNYGVTNSFNFSCTPFLLENYVICNSPSLGTHIYNINDIVIRHDRFSQENGDLVFGFFGADLSSGNISLPLDTNRTFTIGSLYGHSKSFIGDIAEIVGYNRKLSISEVDAVNNYLIQKYVPHTIPFFMYSTTNSSIYKSNNLYTLGAYSGLSNNKTLYIESSQPVLNNIDLFTKASLDISNSFSLYTICSGHQFPPLNLYVDGVNNYNNSNITLYTCSTRYINNDMSLYISASSYSNNNNISLYISNSSGINNYIPLVISGNHYLYNNTTLYTQASVQQWPHISLYTLSVGSSTPSPMILFTKGVTNPTATGQTLLFLYASEIIGGSSIYRDFPLYLEAGKISANMHLFIEVEPINTNPSSTMPLYISGPVYTGITNVSTTLFLCNQYSVTGSPVKRLYIRGAGGLNGGSIYQSDMFPLFIENNFILPEQGLPSYYNDYMFRGYFQQDYWDIFPSAEFIYPIYPQVGIPLYIYNKSSAQTGVSLYAEAGHNTNSNINLFTEGLLPNTGISLFIEGQPSGFNSLILYTNGF